MNLSYTTDTYGTNGTYLGTGDIYMEFYVVLIGAIILFTVGLLAIALNAALLVATRCKKSIRSLQYGLYYCVAIVNLVFCSVWLPLYTIQILLNYNLKPVHQALCYFNVVFYNLFLGSLVFLVFFIGIRHLYTLSAQPMHSMRYMTSKGLAIAWAIAIIAAITAGIEYSYNLDHSLCTKGSLNKTDITHIWYSIHAIIVSFIYILTLFVAIVILWIALAAVKHKMTEMLTPPKYTEDVSCMPSTGFDLSGHEVSHEEPSQTKSFSSIFANPSSTANSCHPSSTDSQSKQATQVNNDVKSTSEEDDDVDDDFDLKMRQKIQKQSSGRRHTVANIGLGDSFLGFGRRRGSLEENKTQKTPSNYSYVRKWSVDITALQNQLENPKLFGGSSALGLNEKREKESIPVELSGITKKKDDNLKKVTEEEEIKEDDEIKLNERETKPENTVFEEEDEEEEDEPTIHDPLATEVPGIVVNGNSPKQGVRTRQNNRTDEECSEELTLQRLHYQIVQTKICIFLVLCTLLVCLPYYLLQLVQTLMDIHINRNLSYVAAPVCLLQAVIQPLLLARMDDKLMSALRKLHVKLTHWKCVCYCNLGKGKQCFGPPSETDSAACA